MINIYKKACIEKIEAKVNWGSSEEWKQRQFNNLSQKIQDQTSVVISPQTLKRFFGKISTNEDYLPQEATLNAFAAFLGYHHWTALEEDVDKRGSSSIKENAPVINEVKASKKPLLKYLAASVLALGLIPILVCVFSDENLPKAKLSTTTQTARAPISVIFNYELPDFKEGQEYFIHFGNSERSTQSLDPNNNTVTQYYPFPGYYKAQIHYNEQVVASQSILLENKDWLKTISQKKTSNKFLFSKSSFDGYLYVNQDELMKYEVDTTEYFSTEFELTKDFGLHMDNTRFETRLQNYRVTDDQFYCNYTHIVLNGEKGRFKLVIPDKKCFNKASLEVSEQKTLGSSFDLSGISKDMSNWTEITIDIHDNEVQIYFDNKLAYETSYDKKLGKLYSVKYYFNTTGKIDYLNLYNFATQGSVFSEDFAKSEN